MLGLLKSRESGENGGSAVTHQPPEDMTMIQQQKRAITFRDVPTEVIFEDHGADPSCNAHVIEWWFADETMNNLTVTDAEEQAVYDDLRSASLGPLTAFDLETL